MNSSNHAELLFLCRQCPCHFRILPFLSADLRLIRCKDYYASLKILTCKCKNRQLTGEGTDKTCQVAQLAASPRWIMNEVNTTVVGIHHSNYEQVRAHEQVSNSQICDQEWVHLAKQEMSVVFIQKTKMILWMLQNGSGIHNEFWYLLVCTLLKNSGNFKFWKWVQWSINICSCPLYKKHINECKMEM